MTPLSVRGLTIGTGQPKVCVPIVAPTFEALQAQTALLSQVPHDLVEWRADLYQEPLTSTACEAVTNALRGVLRDTPLLATIRRKKEGGGWQRDDEDYATTVLRLCACPEVDIVDIEWNIPVSLRTELIRSAKAHQKTVVLSHHNFQKTPSKEFMETCLRDMIRLGADLPKLAVMPHTSEDVLRLLSVTSAVAADTPTPIVTMSMGALGWISRVSGAVFGSAITFGTMQEASAPGQLPATLMQALFEALGDFDDPQTTL